MHKTTWVRFGLLATLAPLALAVHVATGCSSDSAASPPAGSDASPVDADGGAADVATAVDAVDAAENLEGRGPYVSFVHTATDVTLKAVTP